MTNLRQAAQAVIDRWDSPLWKNGSTADAIADLRTALEQQQAEPVADDMAEQLADALDSAQFYRRRVKALQSWQSKMRDPERTIVCDIIANGVTLDPAGDRYTAALEQQAEPVEGNTLLKAFLAAAKEAGLTHLQQAEPVAAESITDAMMNLVDRLGSESKQVDLRAWQHLLVYAPQQQAEPVAYIHRQGNHWEVSERFLLDDEKARGWTEEPIYTRPPQRKPLTDEEIERLWYPSASIAEPGKRRVAFGRAIEAAHNIKEGT